MMKKRLMLFLIVALAAVVRNQAVAADVTVFAAASLTDALKVVAADYEKTSGDKIIFNFGASSTLARQIAEGAPADIFFSADEAQMDGLAKRGLIDPATRKSHLGNTIVVVIPADSTLLIQSAADLTNAAVRKIAFADPKVVPAGVYGRAWLTQTGLWPLIQPKVVPTENVRAALAAVESGNVEAGVVFKTDAGISKKVKIAYAVPTRDAPRIAYPVALVKEAKHAAAARKFLQHLASAEAARVFTRFGFIVRE
jgi:molybdate transport system substrate-binding protein